MFKKIALLLIVVIAGLAVYVAMQPADYRLERSTVIDAPPAQIFPYINDFHKWDEWSPWKELDPDAKLTFEGSESGVGSSMAWNGTKAGEGKLTIVDSATNRDLKMKLEFIRPFPSAAMQEFKIEPVGDDANKSKVTWIMTGQSNFLGKAMCLAMGGMEKMVGPDFEKGLAKMKKVVEKANQK